MKSNYWRIIATMLTLISTDVLSQDRRPAMVMMHGIGLHSCGKYLDVRKTSGEAATGFYQQWAAGYFAGYSDAITKPGMITNLSADLETYTAWLDKWCADDPSSNIYAGLQKLRTKLQGTR